MNIPTIIGKKIEQSQAFLEDGTRVPLTRVSVGENSISQIKTSEKDGYMAVQVTFGNRNKISKPLTGHLKKAGLKKTPRFLREIRVESVDGLEMGTSITPEEVLKAGDKIDVVGVSKGKGFAGGVKRWGFKGGPKTHGQSDRHRAPGSIGQGTTPGRVYKGKKMAGRMGSDRVTIKNLLIADVKDGEILIKGLIPGPKGGLVMITKIGEKKNFKPLYSEIVEEEIIEEAALPVEEAEVENETAVSDAAVEETADAPVVSEEEVAVGSAVEEVNDAVAEDAAVDSTEEGVKEEK